MASTAIKIDIKAYVWNEADRIPTVLTWDGPDDFDRIQRELCDQLDKFEYGKIVATRGDNEPTELYYRAFTCPFRGRQIVSGLDQIELEASFVSQQTYCELKVFSPNDLYNFKSDKVDYNNYHTITVHVPEIDRWSIDGDAVEEAKRMETRYLVDRCPDGRRTWTLGSVWFDGKPVMVVNSSGRDGDEYHERWITDSEQYGQMVSWLHSLANHGEVTGYVKADSIIPAMTEFYGSTIHDFYDVARQELKKK